MKISYVFYKLNLWYELIQKSRKFNCFTNLKICQNINLFWIKCSELYRHLDSVQLNTLFILHLCSQCSVASNGWQEILTEQQNASHFERKAWMSVLKIIVVLRVQRLNRINFLDPCNLYFVFCIQKKIRWWTENRWRQICSGFSNIYFKFQKRKYLRNGENFNLENEFHHKYANGVLSYF